MPITRDMKEQWERELAAADAAHARSTQDADAARQAAIAAAHAKLLPLMEEGKAYTEFPYPMPILVRVGNTVRRVIPEPLYEQGVAS